VSNGSIDNKIATTGGFTRIFDESVHVLNTAKYDGESRDGIVDPRCARSTRVLALSPSLTRDDAF
jgi:hypothetical protein